MRIKYVGPFRPGVDVHLPDGVTVQVPFGEQRTFPDEIARSLLEQGKENWQLVSHYGSEPEPVDYKGSLRPGEIARLMLQRIRAERRWTQAQLVARLEQAGSSLGQTNVSRIESGQRKLSVDDLAELCAALNVSPLRVLTGDRLDPQPPVSVVPTVTVPLSRYRQWLRSSTSLPAPSESRGARGRSRANEFRSVLAPEDLLAIQTRHVDQLARAGNEIADAAIEARDQLSDETRTRLADAIDNFNERLTRLKTSLEERPVRRERRGRPRRRAGA